VKRFELIVVGSSWGGLAALRDWLLGRLGAEAAP